MTLITMEDASLTTKSLEKTHRKNVFRRRDTQTLAIIIIVNLSNILLVCVKGAVALTSGSFSIANSTIESFGDVFVGALILATRIQKKVCGDSSFPHGRTQESLCNVVASVVMIVLACVNGVISIDNFLANQFDPILENEHIMVIGFNMVLKAFLYGLCYFRRDVGQVKVLLKDQRTDVITNGVTVLFAIATRFWSKYFDLLGAVIIFSTICTNWIPILITNANKIGGIQALPWREKIVKEKLEESMEMEDVTNILVYHCGENCVVEVKVRADFCEAKNIKRRIVDVLSGIDWIHAVHVDTEVVAPEDKTLKEAHCQQLCGERNGPQHRECEWKPMTPIEEVDEFNEEEKEVSEDEKTCEETHFLT